MKVYLWSVAPTSLLQVFVPEDRREAGPGLKLVNITWEPSTFTVTRFNMCTTGEHRSFKYEPVSKSLVQRLRKCTLIWNLTFHKGWDKGTSNTVLHHYLCCKCLEKEETYCWSPESDILFHFCLFWLLLVYILFHQMFSLDDGPELQTGQFSTWSLLLWVQHV